MRIIANGLVLFLCVMSASAQTAPSNVPTETADEQTGFCPRTHNLEVEPSTQYWLEGVIGSKTVKMYLERGGSGVVGLSYEPDGDWKPVFLGGMWKASGIDLSAGADSAAFDPETQAPMGRLQGQLQGNVFLGQWTPTGSDHAEPVRLSVIPATGCEGNGAWKRFDSPKWPLSFSYPASWHLVEEHDGPSDYIRLICPDPETMAYDNDVTIEEGVGQPPKVTGLVRCGKKWRYNADCDEDTKGDAYNHDPVLSVRHGMKILGVSGGHEWRAYCRNGGYLGQTEGTDIFILSRNSWIRIARVGEDASDIVGRIVDTVRDHTAK